MRTSTSQFELMVDMMQNNGDLSKPGEGPNGRISNIKKWAELTELLNADATGDQRTSEKWRKDDPSTAEIGPQAAIVMEVPPIEIFSQPLVVPQVIGASECFSSILGTALKTTADHGETDRHPSQSIIDTIDKSHEIFDDVDSNYPVTMKNFRTNFIDYNVRDESFTKHDVNNVNTPDANVNEYTKVYTVGDAASKLKVTVISRNRASDVRLYDADVVDTTNSTHKRSKRQEADDYCESFLYVQGKRMISHPKSSGSDTYARGVDCETYIDATSSTGNIISLDFVDVFHIEDHPSCDYDFLEIRDGMYGYSPILKKLCGESFPPNIKSSGPYLWLKFHSDDTIEYEGFHINIELEPSSRMRIIPLSCNINNDTDKASGVIDTSWIPQDCITLSQSQGSLDVLWTIKTKPDTKIHLNFTEFNLEKPNECNDNYVEVFGAKTDIPSRFEIFCGSMANSVITKDKNNGNIMYIHLYVSNRAKKTNFNATYTAFRILDTDNDEKCNLNEEFDCEDNTCIAIGLKCDKYAHCRLKTDEDYDICKGETASLINQVHILVILIIFCLILSGMSFVFLYKCIRKLVQDHKIIKEHIRQSCEDRLDSLDVRKLHRESQPRASLERENHTNEMFKKQRSLSHHKPSSIDSDFIQETHLDLEDDPWRRDVESIPIEAEDIRIEQNGRRRSEFSRKEEAFRKDRIKEQNENVIREKKEIRDVGVGAPDTKESGCQTRESLFQTGTASSDGTDSGSNGRAFSTFGYSGATLVRKSPPVPPVAASQITIELLRTVPPEPKTKKLPDRRPISNETTRSAPDVIIVSKPIR